MRRARRIIADVASAVSLLLLVGMFPLAVRGHWFADCAGYASAPRGWPRSSRHVG